MLIKKNDTGDIVKSYYNSSNLLTSEYNKKNKTLLIVFKHGGSYQYKNVPITDFTRFEMADSQGVELNKTIKPKYPFEKVDSGDIKIIEEEIKQLNLEDLKDEQGIIISKMNEIIHIWEEDVLFDNDKLKNLFSLIENYQNKILK